jgi:SAM-dependent methyltransferase
VSTTPPDPETAKGFSAVDAQPDPSFLVAGMEATAEWPAVIQLRDFERAAVVPVPGDRVLDVGCGIADVARRYAALVSPGGRVLGIDASEAMLAVARDRAAGRDGRFWMSVTMTTVMARRPG